MDGCQNGLIWNSRGVKTASREIKELCKMDQPGFLFISETKIGDVGISKLARKLGFDKFESSRTGKAGGIALFWHDQCTFNILIKEKYFIHCVAHDKLSIDNWYITFIQGPPCAVEKQKLLEKIRGLRN